MSSTATTPFDKTTRRAPRPSIDASPRGWPGARVLPRDRGRRRSIYLTMRDGARLAVDVHLPSKLGPGERAPTILRQTRYFRSHEMPRLLDVRATRDAFDIVGPTRERFLARGYAWVDVDVRGSGVSSGSWPAPWSPAEVEDGAAIVDFIVKQPWSNGAVGSTGISYEGTTSEMLLVNRHPAVRAIAPRFSLLCAYEDIAFPGGAHLGWFTDGWSRYNRLLDDHAPHRATAELVYIIASARSFEPGAPWAFAVRALLDRLGPERAKRAIAFAFGAFLRGGRKVDADPEGLLRARALLDHAANGDVHALCAPGSCRDDPGPEGSDVGFSVVSPRGNLAAIASSGAAIFGYGGWLDGAYAQAAARRFASLGRTELLIGPWGHGGFLAHDPRGRTAPAGFSHDEALIDFFDRMLSPEPTTRATVRYFTLGESRWKTASSWPPAGTRSVRLVLGAHRELVDHDVANAAHEIVEDRSFGTGERSRWRGLLAAFVPADYPDFEARIRSAVRFTSRPFERGAVLTGHPTLSLVARADRDFVVFAYLVDVAPNGAITYVTEGELRAAHRKTVEPEPGYVPLGPCRSFHRADMLPIVPNEAMTLSFAMLPTSYAIEAGHRVALVLTLGDRDHFAPLADAARSVSIVAGASTLELPFEGAAPIG